MEQIFLRVLNMSISAGYVILAILLARGLLRRAPKKYAYALWSVAAFRLCCPVSFQSVFSLFRLGFFDLRGGAALTYVPSDIGMMAQPEVNVGISSANAIINGSLPAARSLYSANPMQIWLAIAVLIWCAGMAAMLLWFLLRYGLLHFRLRTATRLEGNVFESARVDAPFALGLFRPRIYLPYGLDAETRRHVLAHERHHLRHGDHILRPFGFLLLALHWFNPLCWVAYALMGRDMELRCDEAVLASGVHDPADYSAALLRFAAPQRFPTPGPLSFGEPAAAQRIRNALRWRKPKRWVTVAAVVAVVAVVLGCAANPNVGSQDKALFAIRVGNVETPIETKWFEDGTFDFDYDLVPIVTVSEAVQLVVSREAEELVVGVDLYTKRGSGTVIEQETYTLARAADGHFVLDISLEPEEFAIVFVPLNGGKHIFKVEHGTVG